MAHELNPEIIEKLPLAILIYDVASKNIVYVNPAFRELVAFSNDVPTIDQVLSGIREEDKAYLTKVYEELLQGIYPKKVDVLYQSANGSNWLRILPSLISKGSSVQVVVTVQSIEEEVENYSVRDKYANKKNAVLNILAHDLAGPLSVANTIVASLKNSVDSSLSAQIESVVKIIDDSYNLIRDLTNREFLEASEVQLVKDRVDIVQKLKDYFDEYLQSEQLTKRTFVFNSSSHSIFMELDEIKFVQVINNLTTNALKFTQEGALISLSVEDKDDHVFFTFSDSGIGIPDKFKDSLFEQYTPACRKGLQGEPSIGMGLWVVKTIIEWHNGKIWFESKENEGTSFFFELPKRG